MESILEIILSAQDTASETIKAFGEELNNVIEIAAGFSLANVSAEFVNAGKTAIDAAINFQSVTTSLGTVLANVSDGGAVAADNMGGSAGKMKDIASRTADEMRNYAERVKKYQQDIADTMVGENVIRAQESLQDKLSKITDEITSATSNEADKEADRKQKMQDTLADMTAAHNTKEADRKEKYEYDMANAVSEIQKQTLTKRFNEEEKLGKDSFDRQYADKQAQLQRNMDEQNKSDREALQQRIDALNKQRDEEKKSADQSIADLKVANAKKLADYKQRLDDEELLHKEHLARLADESEKAGAGASNHIAQALAKDSPFRAIRRSLQDELKFITTIEPSMPFNFEDIVGLDRHMTQFGDNFQTTYHMIGDAASAANVDLRTAGQAITDATKAGRWQMLEQDLGITKERLTEFGAEFDKQGHLMNEGSFWQALQKMDQKGGPIFDAMTNQMGTMKGQLTNLHTTFFQLGLDILGVDAASGKVTKGGLFDQMTHVVMDFANYLKAHKTEIADFFKNLFKGIEDVAKFLTNDFNPTMDNMVKLFDKYAYPVIKEFMKIIHDNQKELKDMGDKFKDILTHAGNLWKLFDKDFGPTLKVLTEHAFKEFITDLDRMATLFDLVFKLVDGLWKKFDNLPKGFKDGLSAMAGFGVAGLLNHHAAGTNFAPGGPSIVGENGPELVNLPRGSQVIPNSQINNYSNRNANVTLGPVYVNSEMDVDTMVRRLTMRMKFNSAI